MFYTKHAYLLFAVILLVTLNLLPDDSEQTVLQNGQITSPVFQCATDHLHNHKMTTDPKYASRHEAMEKQITQFLEAKKNGVEKSVALYTLPVVVHIIHDNGPENISDALVLEGIDHLNNAFENIGYYDPATGVNTDIEFCLAKQDPDGNATNGITRDVSSLTVMNSDSDDVTVKDINRWDPTSYVNIWLVNEICNNNGCGVAGYAYFPSAHGSDVDGIMMEAEYFGSTPGGSGVIIHELGHYLGVYHTFQGGCLNNDCMVDGDRVCDTPPDQSTAAVPCNATPNSCMTDTDSGFATDQNDMFINYMDYGDFDCYSAFTQGQTDRMHAAIVNTRLSLLDSPGCNDPCLDPLTASFTVLSTTVDAGTSVDFTNTSTNSTTYVWQIDGVEFSTSENPSYLFDVQGIYEITLLINNVDPNCMDAFTIEIEVICPVEASFDAGDNNALIGQTINFTNTSTNGVTYEWFVDGTAVSTDTDFSTVFNDGGVHQICLEASNGVCIDNSCQIIQVIGNLDADILNFYKRYGDAESNIYGDVIYHPEETAFYAIGRNSTGSINSLAPIITKLDGCGEILWTKRYANSTAFTSIALSPDGDLVCQGLLRPSDNDYTLYVCKVDPDGNLIWDKTYDRSGRMIGNKLVASISDPDGEAYFVRTWKSSGGSSDDNAVFKIDGDGNILWAKDYENGGDEQMSDLVAYPGGGCKLVGSASSIQWNAFVTTLDKDGNEIESFRYETDIEFFPREATLMDDEGLVISGYLHISGTQRRAFLMRIDGNGDVLWKNKYETPGQNSNGDVVRDIHGDIYTSGFDNVNGQNVYRVFKFDADGNFIWAKKVGSTSQTTFTNGSSIKHTNTFPERIICFNYDNASGFGDTDGWVATLDTALTSCQTETYNPNLIDFDITKNSFQWSVTDVSYTIGSENMEGDIDFMEENICDINCSNEICDNGLDDDNDGFIDCADADCDCLDCNNTFFTILSSEPTNQGIDDGGNVLIKDPFTPHIYLGGYANDGSIISKMNLNGNIEWTKHFDFISNKEQISALSIDSDYNLLGSGYGADNGVFQGFVFKYNLITESLEWQFALPLGTRTTAILEPIAGNDYFLSAVRNDSSQPGSFDDAILLTIDRDAGTIINTNSQQFYLGTSESFNRVKVYNGEIYTCGRYTDGSGFENMRCSISKFDLDGNELWSKMGFRDASSTARLYGYDMEVINDAIYTIILGDSDGTTDFSRSFFMKSNLDGEPEWVHYYDFDASSNTRIRDLEALSGGFLILGYFIDNDDLFLLKTDQNGAVLWAKILGTAGDDVIDLFEESLLVDGDSYFVTGRTNVSGDDDILLVKLDQDGTVTSEGCMEVMDAMVTNGIINDPVMYDVDLNEYPIDFTFTPANATPADYVLGEEQLCLEECPEICDNGIDDDGDGDIDCEDDECPCGDEICDNGIDDDGDGLIDCFDPDCCGDTFCEGNYYQDCPVDCEYNIPTSDLELQLDWQSQDQWHEYNVPFVADLDGDGIPEAIGRKGNHMGIFIYKDLQIINGADGSLNSTIVTPYMYYTNSHIAIADIDADGFGEIIINTSEDSNPIGEQRRLICYEHDGTQKWISSQYGYEQLYEWATPAIADFDEDGLAEVYIGNQIFDALTGTLLAEGGATLNDGRQITNATTGISNFAGIAADVLPTGDCANCEGKELIFGNQVLAVNLTTGQVSLERELTGVDITDGLTSIADIDMDGDLDAVVATKSGTNGVIYAWDLQTETQLGQTFSFLAQVVTCCQGTTSLPIIGDFDNDGAPEIGFSSVNEFRCLEFNAGAAFTEKWVISTTDASGQTGATLFDFQADGSNEVLYRDQTTLRILNGATGAVITSEPCASGTGTEYPVVADVDGDGASEVLCSCNSQLNAYGSALGPWAPSRKVWNQHSYFNVNINDDLTVPKMQQAPYLVGDGIVMNTFLAQYSDPAFPVPDATVLADSIWCLNDEIGVRLSVCNIGDALLSDQIPIQFYDGDPQTAAANVFYSTTLAVNVEPDSCTQINLAIPGMYGIPIYVVVNDDQSLATPYTLADDFPITAFPECEFENNIDNFSIDNNPIGLDLGPDITVCANGVINFDAGPGFQSYLWQDYSDAQIFTAHEAGTFWVTVTDFCGNVQSDTVSVILDSLHFVDLGLDTIICLGDSVTFNVPGYVDYEWLPLNQVPCDTCAEVTFMPTEPMSYKLVVANASDCYSVDSVFVDVIYPSESFDTLVICAGDTVDVFGQPISMPGDYFELFEAFNSCDSIANITVISSPPISINLVPMSSCLDENNGTITSDVSGGSAPYNYQWSVVGEQDSNLENLSTGNYSLTVTDNNSCTETATVFLDSVASVIVDIETTDVSCYGESDGAILVNTLDPTLVFAVDTANFSNGNSFNLIPVGEHILFIQDADGCIYEQTFIINGPPELVVQLPDDVTIQLGDSLTLLAIPNTLDSLAYLWEPPTGLNCIDCQEVIAMPLMSLGYLVNITDGNGCEAVDSIFITVDEQRLVYIPTGFSPNGDGYNDLFTVYSGTGVEEIVNFKVFDRWGELIFDAPAFEPSFANTVGWDGTFKNRPMNNGVFVYLIDVRFSDGVVVTYSGSITLLK